MEHLQRLFEKFVPKVLDFRSHHCKELIPTSELNSVISLCVLFDALATEENGVRFCRRLSLLFSFFFVFSKMLFINIFVVTLTGKCCEANLQHLHKITRCVDSPFSIFYFHKELMIKINGKNSEQNDVSTALSSHYFLALNLIMTEARSIRRFYR